MKFEIIKCEEPKDFFEDCTVSLYDWMKNIKQPDTFQVRLEVFNEAYDEVKKLNSGDLRDVPRVGYDYEKDTYFFIFKYENNGETIIVKRIY